MKTHIMRLQHIKTFKHQDIKQKEPPQKIRKRRSQKKIPTPKTEVGKNQTNNQVLIA